MYQVVDAFLNDAAFFLVSLVFFIPAFAVLAGLFFNLGRGR